VLDRNGRSGSGATYYAQFSQYYDNREWGAKMAKLSTEARKEIPAKSFAEPDKRKYPIENKAHAKNALSRVSQSGTTAEKTKVRAAVKKKYPSLGKKDK
jgi:hypothetical protein